MIFPEEMYRRPEGLKNETELDSQTQKKRKRGKKEIAKTEEREQKGHCF